MDERSIQKYIKQVRDEVNEDMKQHIGALVEDINDKFKATNEALVGINKKLDSHTDMLAEISEDLTLIKVQIGDHESRITELETRV